MILRQYWFKLKLTLDDEPPSGTLLGCGVTANSLDEAVELIANKIFQGVPPEIESVIEDVKPEMLDERHVLPNMEDPEFQ